MKIHPPKKALAFLRWFCREDFLEEIEGDSFIYRLAHRSYVALHGMTFGAMRLPARKPYDDPFDRLVTAVMWM